VTLSQTPNSLEKWEDVCVAPCNPYLNLEDTFRLAGGDYEISKPFRVSWNTESIYGALGVKTEAKLGERMVLSGAALILVSGVFFGLTVWANSHHHNALAGASQVTSVLGLSGGAILIGFGLGKFLPNRSTTIHLSNSRGEMISHTERAYQLGKGIWISSSGIHF
jgi:hypothetical protein